MTTASEAGPIHGDRRQAGASRRQVGPGSLMIMRTFQQTLIAAALAAAGIGIAALPASAATITGPTLYAAASFGDRAITLGAPIENLASVGFNDVLSSIKVPAGPYWCAYTDPNYRGEMTSFSPGTHSYVGDYWNDRISSIRPC